MKTPLLPGLKLPKVIRRIIARAVDIGSDEYGNDGCEYHCRRCGWKEWQFSSGPIKRTTPCPKCNPMDKSHA